MMRQSNGLMWLMQKVVPYRLVVEDQLQCQECEDLLLATITIT